MLNAQSTVAIERPPEVVFAFLAEVDNLPLWATGVVEAHKLSPGPLSKGTELEHVMQLLGKRFTSRFETTECEPEQRLAFRTTSGPVDLETIITLEATARGTSVHYLAVGNPRGFFKIAEPVLVRIVTRQLDNSLANLKDLLEAAAKD